MANFSKIVYSGLPFAMRPSFGVHVTNVGQLTLNDGSMVQNSNLLFNLGTDGGEIILTDGSKLAQFEYFSEVTGNGNILLLKTLTNTYRGEGSGLGSAMRTLGDKTIAELAEQFDGYESIYAVGEDTATNREAGIVRSEWSSDLLKSMGYSDNHRTLESLDLSFKTRKMFVKKIA